MTGVKLAGTLTAPLHTVGAFPALMSAHDIVDIADAHVSIDASVLSAVELHLLWQQALVPWFTQSAIVPAS